MEEEALPELQRTISGDLMAGEDTDQGLDESMEDAIFRVRGNARYELVLSKILSWFLTGCVAPSQRSGGLFGNHVDPFALERNTPLPTQVTSHRPLQISDHRVEEGDLSPDSLFLHSPQFFPRMPKKANTTTNNNNNNINNSTA